MSVSPDVSLIREYLKGLAAAHRILSPRNYIEIGVNKGKSLAVANCPSVGVDPNFSVEFELDHPCRLFRQTSDEFFAKYSSDTLFGEPFDLCFIDGMHLVEFALRDFINLEKNASKSAVIFIDDVLPGNLDWAGRKQTTELWSGDIYKIITILKAYRPDLRVRVFDFPVKGLAVIDRLNPFNRTLLDSYPEIERGVMAGEFEMNCVNAIRNTAAPQPAEQLPEHLSRIAIDQERSQR